MIKSRKIYVPPIKCQGIKTKIVPLIKANVEFSSSESIWYEPFMGSGVVGFNVQPERALFCDVNPHIVNFYNSLKEKKITSAEIRNFLTEEGEKLSHGTGEHYYTVRERFNDLFSPLDFLFLSRSCFNGIMRFNSKGFFNVPFCKKPNRFSKSYITKIVNQVKTVEMFLDNNDWNFKCQHFSETISEATELDFIYCDPPYLGRHVDYFDSWDEDDELKLNRLLMNTKAFFMISTWLKTQFRENDMVEKLWKDFQIVQRKHFYHVGGFEKNRNEIIEILIMNFTPLQYQYEKQENIQRSLVFQD